MSICPVCGKGTTTPFGPDEDGVRLVSHLACVEERNRVAHEWQLVSDDNLKRAEQAEADYSAVVTKCADAIIAKEQAEAELAALKAKGQVIDVKPAGCYLTNVHPVVLNVVEDGYVEYLDLALDVFIVVRAAREEES